MYITPEQVIEVFKTDDINFLIGEDGHIQLTGENEEYVNKYTKFLRDNPEIEEALKRQFPDIGQVAPPNDELSDVPPRPSDQLRQKLHNRPPIMEADIRAVNEYFINWAYEFGDVPIHYREFYEMPSLPVRMQKGRKAGEPLFDWSCEVWEIDQPPINLPEWKIKNYLKWLSSNGYILHEVEKDSRGKIIDDYYSAIQETDIEDLFGIGYVYGQTMKRGIY